MDRDITRRDFINGVSFAVGAALLPACSGGSDPVESSLAAFNPPAQTGMRGSHPGSFEVAHGLMQGQQWKSEKTDEHYDLVVVGAGISGLSAAFMYRRDVDPNARILIIDNHDDFGGHAKRNELDVDGKTVIGFGGTMFIESPKIYPAVSKRVLNDLGIEAETFSKYHHEELFSSFGMGRASFFDKETFGQDYLATGSSGELGNIDNAPISAAAKEQLQQLFADETDYLEGKTLAERHAAVESLSYRDYLRDIAGMGDEVLTYVQRRSHGGWGIGADALPAFMAWLVGYPGFAGVPFDDAEDGGDTGPRMFHFPDGNATVARLLVRKLVPGIAPGDTMLDVVTARFDYAKIDQPANDTRIRLRSTVIRLQHRDGRLDGDVDISYVTDNQGYTVSASKVVFAGYHAMLPRICPDVSEQQAAALQSSVRSPLVYTNVWIRNWHSFEKLGFWRAYCPGCFFQSMRITFPVSIGDYRFAQTPEEPVVLHLQHIPLDPGKPAVEQFRSGRQQLLTTPFETFERNVRDQLRRILGPGGFDPATDIAGITVNRWPHGYAYSHDFESGETAWWPERWTKESRPWVDARQPIGNIVIAGTDASSNAMTESAMQEANRAIGELETSHAS